MSLLQELMKIGDELREKYDGKFDEYLKTHNKDFASVVYNQTEFELFLDWYYELERTTRAHFIKTLKEKKEIHFVGVFHNEKRFKEAIKAIVEKEELFLNDSIYSEVEIHSNSISRKIEDGNSWLYFNKGDVVYKKTLNKITIFRYNSLVYVVRN